MIFNYDERHLAAPNALESSVDTDGLFVSVHAEGDGIAPEAAEQLAGELMEKAKEAREFSAELSARYDERHPAAPSALESSVDTDGPFVSVHAEGDGIAPEAAEQLAGELMEKAKEAREFSAELSARLAVN